MSETYNIEDIPGLLAERAALIEALEQIETILDSDRGGEPYARGQCIGIAQAALAAARAGETT